MAPLTWNADAKGRDTSWEGGIIRYSATGKPTFVITKMVKGRRYNVSTRAHTISAALKHLPRFEADPAAYTKKDEQVDPIFLAEALTDEFLAHSRDVKKNSPNWISTQRIYLAWWREQLKGRDLRHMNLRDDIDPVLANVPGKAHRIKVLKALMAWLRKEKRLLTTAEDATIDLPVPQARPEQARRMKAITIEQFEKTLKKLKGDVRAGLLVLGATGCHYSELERFIRDGTIEPVPKGKDEGDADAVLMFGHKSGVPHRVRIGKAALTAAKQLKKRGVAWDPHTFNAELKAACEAAKVPVFHAGQMRHSVATWAVNEGADPASVAAFLGHRSVSTLKRFYSTHAAPKRVPSLVR